MWWAAAAALLKAVPAVRDHSAPRLLTMPLLHEVVLHPLGECDAVGVGKTRKEEVSSVTMQIVP